MKVLHLFYTYLPKTQTWAFNLLRYTPDTDVHIGAYRFLEGNWIDEGFTKVTSKLSFVERKIGALGKILPGDYSMVTDRARQIFINWYVKFALVPYSKKNDINIIHAHFAHAGYFFLEAKKRLKIPFIVSFYGMDYEYLPYTNPAYKDYYKKLFNVADGFICEGAHGKKTLVNEYGVDPEKIKIVHLGVESEKIEFIKRTKKINALKLVQISSYNKKKGHEYTLKAFAKSLEKCPNMKLTLVGRGPTHKECIELATGLDLNSHVEFVDFIDYATLHSFLKDFDVFIHPSCYSDDHDCEGGAPVVLLDAQATGMPIISTKHCDIPSEVINEKTGLLSTEKNVDEIAQNIERFYHMDDQEYTVFSTSAFEHIEENYNISKNALLLKKIYTEFLDKSEGSFR